MQKTMSLKCLSPAADADPAPPPMKGGGRRGRGLAPEDRAAGVLLDVRGIRGVQGGRPPPPKP